MALSQERKEEIISVTMDLNEKFNFPETSIVQLARSFKIKIKNAEFKEEMVDGIVTEDKEIFVNSLHPLPKQNHTIAHEIGHLMLKHSFENGKKYRIDGIDYANSDKDIINENEEIEANVFASHLLVPEDKLQKVLSKLRTAPKWYIYEFCSRYFNVPRGVIMNRLKWLHT